MVASRIKEFLPVGGRIYRYGGDEFVVITALTDREEVRKIAEEIILLEIEGLQVKYISTSVGITIFPEPGDTPESVLKRADFTLFRAKHAGRGVYLFHDDRIEQERFTLVGRKEELKTMTSIVDTVMKGEGCIVEVNGEAGIGKTRLVQESAELFSNWGGLVISAGGVSFSTLPPFYLFTTILKDMYIRNRDLFLRVLENLSGEYRRRIEFVVENKLDIEKEPGIFQDSILNFFRVLSVLNPVMLILDDVQWADTRSIDLMNILSSGISRFKMLLCYIVRTPIYNKRLEYILKLFHRYPNFTRIQLGPLKEGDMEKLAPLFRRMGKNQLKRIHKLSGGNPLFMEQLISAPEILFRGVDYFKETPELTGIIEAKIKRLDENSVLVLKIVSLLEESPDSDFLSRVSGIDKFQIEDIVDNLSKIGLLRIKKDTKTYEFTHGIVKWAIHNRIPVPERRELHRRIAQEMVKKSPNTINSVFSIAHHFISAGDKKNAYEYTIRAGDMAERVKGYFEASNLYGAAIDLFDVNDEERKILGERLVNALTESGMGEEAVQGIMKVLRDVRKRGEKEKIDGLLYNLAYSYYRAGKHDELLRFSEKVLEEMDQSSGYYWTIRFLVASAVNNDKDADRTIEIGKAGLEFFKDKTESLYNYAFSCHLISIGYVAKQRIKESLKYSKKAMEIYGKTEGGVPSWIWNDHAEVLMASGNYKEAEKWLSKTLEAHEDMGNLWLLSSYMMNMAIVEREREEYVQSSMLLEKAIEYAGMCQVLTELDIARASMVVNRLLQEGTSGYISEDFRNETILNFIDVYRGVSLIQEEKFEQAVNILVSVWNREKKSGFPMIVTTGIVLPPMRILFLIVMAYILDGKVGEAERWNSMLMEGAEQGGAHIYRKYADFLARVIKGEKPSLRPLNPLSFSLEKRLVWWMKKKLK
ncbi:hypothetical protein DRQ17_01145 [bacterium]|nr:MAG: hypothetical protein DRQ17_01145 [bacterium]